MIKLIEYSKDDFNYLSLLFQNPDVMRYTLDDCYSQDELKNYFRKILGNNESKNRKQYEYKVIINDEFIGFADFEITQTMRSGGIAEIGYLILPEHWGKGYGTLIAKELINVCFNRLNLHKVTASCNIDNIGSWKVMEKAGMKKEGTFEAHRFKNGKFVNELKYGLVNKAFLI
jgi:ribosomal-protein-alanine N-acetyltransferase